MAYELTEYQNKDDDGNVVSSVRVHEVAENEDGEAVLTTGGARTVRKGEILVQAPNPNYYDVFTAEEWGKLNYDAVDSGGSGVQPQAAETPAEVSPVDATTHPGGTNADNGQTGGV